jgi:catabolite repression HPr-like protein
VKKLKEQSVTVKLETGLQARPAAQFVQEANRYASHLFLEKDGKKVNAKSIMGLMSLAITKDEEIKLIADGADEDAAISSLVAFVSKEE